MLIVIGNIILIVSIISLITTIFVILYDFNSNKANDMNKCKSLITYKSNEHHKNSSYEFFFKSNYNNSLRKNKLSGIANVKNNSTIDCIPIYYTHEYNKTSPKPFWNVPNVLPDNQNNNVSQKLRNPLAYEQTKLKQTTVLN